METLEQIGIKAKKASRYLAKLGIDEKNKALEAVADALTANAESIIAANEKDLVNAKANGMKPALIDRLTLDVKRINAMADGIRVLTGLEDPVGEVTGMKKRPNGLVIGTKRVPLGVVAIIYESRPNVTADAFGLTFKSGNACILRGGSDSINSNIAIADVIAKAVITPEPTGGGNIKVTFTKYVEEKDNIKGFNQGEALFICGRKRMTINVVVTEQELDSFGSGGGL